MHTVLVVEDEPRLRSEMVEGLSQVGAIDVEAAGTLREAQMMLRRERPQLIIADLNLPDGSAITLLQQLKDQSLESPIIFISQFIDRYRDEIPAGRDVILMEKPVTLETLVALTVDRLRAQGRGQDLQAMVQLARSGGYSSVIEVTRDGATLGRIVVKSGEIWSARSGTCRGLAAVNRLCKESVVSLAVRPLDSDDTIA